MWWVCFVLLYFVWFGWLSLGLIFYGVVFKYEVKCWVLVLGFFWIILCIWLVWMWFYDVFNEWGVRNWGLRKFWFVSMNGMFL